VSDFPPTPHQRHRPAPYEDLRLLIGRMDGKLDIVLQRSHEHEHRISALEAWKNKALGWVLAVAFAGGAGADQLVRLVMTFR
jgi:hypothetical protein